MWDLGNRGIIVLISALAGCVFAYNSTVSILVLIVTVTFILVSAYACYCLFVSDSSVPFPRHGIHQISCFIQETVRQLNDIFEHTVLLNFLRYLRNFRDVIQRFYNERIAIRMQKPRSSIGYQLSTDACIPRSPSSRFGTIDKFSPIPRLNAYETQNAPPRNSAPQRSPANENRSFSKYTSTPLVPWRKDDTRNGDLTWNGRSSSKKTPIHTQNHNSSLGENSAYYNPNESPWGSGANPKMRPKAAGVKTVQTTAGPLLASTRYNIDPKVYSDVISPGLTTRLSKYAMEANDKLTHESEYGTGQFPRVNLNAPPIPLINAKLSKARTPVMVRIAPPEVTRYSPPERQKILSNMCLRENKEQNVAHVLREISLKRHASREDVASDIAKKQRTDNAFSNNVTENIEESAQKRNRDESSKSEEDLSLYNKTIRPTKRSKAPSCYDILNSLSSSVHVISGVKRKADLSRSGTPDFGKHFKSIDNSQSGDAQGLSRPSVGSPNQSNNSNEKYSTTKNAVNHTKRSTDNLKKEILQSSSKDYVNSNNKITNSVQVKEQVVPLNDVQLKDKLFMRAEPQKNEKLRLLVEEHNDVKAKFTTDDVEEIRKEDIVNMRQTSMRARLQSMFDAISGKTKSKINPDVVIQAEDVTVSNAGPTPSTCVTLNSSTTTTNINTSPITTSAIAPIESATKSSTKTTKHVTFNLPVAENSIKPNDTMSTAATPTNGKVMSSTLDQEKPSPVSTVTISQPAGSISSIFSAINASSTPMFTFGSSSSTPISTTSSMKNSNVPSTNTVPSSTSIFLMNVSKSTTTPSSNNRLLNLKSQLNATSSTNVNSVTATVNPSSAPCFTFGNSSIVATPAFGNNTSVSLQQNVIGVSTSNAAVTAGNLQTSTTNIAGITTSKTATDQVATSTAPTALFTFGSNATAQTTSFNTLQTTKPTGFTLDTRNPPNASIFGTVTTASNVPTTSSTGNAFSATVATTTATIASDKNTTSTLPAFGAPAASTSVFSFGTSSALSTSNNKPAFSFNTTSTGTPSTTSSATTLFGTSTNAGATPNFGTTSTTATQQFGATTAPVFGSTQSAGQFCNPNLFTGITSPSSSASSSFSTLKPASATTFNSSTTAPTFGTPKSTASRLFSNVNSDVNTSASTSKPPAFGTTTNAFGQATTSSSFGTSTAVFGNTSTTLFGSQTTTANAFGASTPPTTTASSFASGQNLPAFGTPNVGTTGITSSCTTTTPAFGTPSTNPNTGFGSSTTAPAFGSNAAPPTGGFGTPSTSATTFGTQAAPSLAFGTANNSSNAFGSNVSSPFAATQANTSAAPAFGASNSTSTFGSNANNASNSTFSFGGTQTNLQPNTTFSFGSNTATSNAGSTASAPFQFGASSSKPASTGFNFSAPPATPNINFGSTGSAPVFNAPTAGMFSIGSGSTAPRSRSTRPRKPR